MVYGLACSPACGNLPRPGMRLMSRALADGFLITRPAGKPGCVFLNMCKTVTLFFFFFKLDSFFLMCH